MSLDAAGTPPTAGDVLLTNLRLLGLDQEQVAKGVYSDNYKRVELHRDMFHTANPLALELILYALLTALPGPEHRSHIQRLRRNFPVWEKTAGQEFRAAAVEMLKALPLGHTVLNVKSVVADPKGDRVTLLLLRVSRHVLQTLAGADRFPFASSTPSPGTVAAVHPPAVRNALKLLIHKERQVFEEQCREVLRLQAEMQQLALQLQALVPAAAAPSPEARPPPSVQLQVQQCRQALRVYGSAAQRCEAMGSVTADGGEVAGGAADGLLQRLQCRDLLQEAKVPHVMGLPPELVNDRRIDLVALTRRWHASLESLLLRSHPALTAPTGEWTALTTTLVKRMQTVLAASTQLLDSLAVAAPPAPAAAEAAPVGSVGLAPQPPAMSIADLRTGS